jgi:hypothetical protein
MLISQSLRTANKLMCVRPVGHRRGARMMNVLVKGQTYYCGCGYVATTLELARLTH